MTAVAATDLRYSYPDGTLAVDGVDVTVAAGERVALLGPNGAGKSTVLQLLGGLVEPDEGRVRYFGETSDADSVRDRLSVLTQNPADYLFNPTVEEDLRYGPAQQDLPEREVDRRVEHVADRLDLTDLLSKPPFRLSGGQQRRAALASALTVEPDLLLLDEPVSNVDAANRAEILDLLAELAAAGTTVVTSTPDTELVPHVADRAVLFESGGTVAARGSTREILTDTALLADCDLRPPQVVRLFGDREPERSEGSDSASGSEATREDREPERSEGSDSASVPLTVAEARERLDGW